MQELADYFPDLAPALQAVIHRIVDLLPVAREHYYHPEMRGSWSIHEHDAQPNPASDHMQKKNDTRLRQWTMFRCIPQHPV